MMILRIMIKIIALNVHGAHRLGLVLSGLYDLSGLSYLSLPATLWCKHYYTYFIDEATETQTSLPSL